MPSSSFQFDLTGAVLAGGQSTRMGRDKASLVMPDGRTMMQHVTETLRIVCSGVVTVGPHMDYQIDRSFDVRDARTGCGPLAGIEALLASGVDRNGQYLICPCDAPMMCADVLRLLAAPARATAVVFQVKGRPSGRFECMPLRIAADALPRVREHLDRGELAAWRMIAELDPLIIDIDEVQAACLRNVNTPEDFSQLCAKTSAPVHSIAR